MPRTASPWRWGETQDDLGMDRRLVFGTSGMSTLWSAEPLNMPSLQVKLNGVGGEPWCTNYPASGRLARLRQFRAWLYAGQKIGDAGLVTAEARAADVWPEALGELVASPLLTRDLLASPERPVSGTGGQPKTVGGRPSHPKHNVSTDNRVATAVTRLEAFRSLVIDDPSHSLFDVLDREAVRRAVGGYVDLPHPQKQ